MGICRYLKRTYGLVKISHCTETAKSCMLWCGVGGGGGYILFSRVVYGKGKRYITDVFVVFHNFHFKTKIEATKLYILFY